MNWFDNYRVAIGLVALLFASVTGISIDATPWIMRSGLSSDQYRDFCYQELPAGFRPVSVNGHGSIGAARFAGIWINDGNHSPWVERQRSDICGISTRHRYVEH